MPHNEILYMAIGKEPLMQAVTDTKPRQFVFERKYKIQLYEEEK